MKIAKLIAESTARPWHDGFYSSDGYHICATETGRVIAGVYENQDRQLIVALANSAEALVDLVRAARALGSVPHEYNQHNDKQCPACANAIAFQEALAALPEDWRDE